MSLPALQIDTPECPAVLLPTPGNLSNAFGKLATFPGKLTALAATTAKEEAEIYLNQAKELQSTIDGLRTAFAPYDPKFEKLSIPEKEWQIMIQRLVEEYPMYIQAQIMSLITTLFPISFNLPIMGLSIDVVKLVTDRTYLTTLVSNISGDELNRLYALLPSEYKLFDGEYGLENLDLKKKQVVDYIKNESAKFMNGQLFTGFGGLISAFQDIWDALGLPALPVPLSLDVKSLVDTAIANAKDDAAKLAALKNISIAGFKVDALLGGDIVDDFESLEFQIARINSKLKEFAEGYQLFLIRQWMGKVTSFFSAIGLSTLTQYATLNFCTFLGLMNISTNIDLSSFNNISQVAAPNHLGTNEDGTPITLQSIIEEKQEQTGE